MSINIHLHDKDDAHIGDVCVPGPLTYRPALHRTGAHSYEPLGEATDSLQEALHRLTDALVEDTARLYNRGGVWGEEREPSYYEPIKLFEVRRA